MMRTRCIIVLAFCAALFVYSFPRESGDNLGLLVRSRDLDLAPLSDADEGMMEQIWSNCKLDLFGTNSVMEAVNEYIADKNAGDSTKFDLKKLPFLRENLQNAIIKLPSDIRYPLIDCLMDQILLFPRNRYSRRPARLFDQSTLSIKHLAGQSVNNNLFSSVFSAAVLTPLRRNLVSETNLVALGGLNSNTLQPSSEAPAPENDPENLSPAPIPGGYLAPEVNNPSPKHAVAPSEQKSNNTKTIIIAVVVTATVTLTLAALCFCCFYRYLRNKYQFDNGQRDESPLLSLSDISVSSHMAFGQANSFHNDKNGSLPLKADPNRNVQALPLDSLSNSQLDAAYSIVSSTVDPKAPSHATEPAPPPLPTMKGPPVSMVSTIPPAPPPSLTNPMPPPAPSVGGPPPPKGGPPPPKGGPPLPKPTPPPKGGPPLPKVGPPRPPQASSSSSTIPLAKSRISGNNFDSDGSKTKLKPFFWDKVMTNPDQSMVWHRIKSGSFHFNEEMIESLFGYNAADKSWNDAKKDLGSDPSARRIQILDPKKSQNLAISLRAWNVKVEEVCDALMEGNELPVDLLQALLRMAPTSDEELKLKLFNDNTALLGPAEQFLKAIVNIPFAFKRMDALLLMTTLQEESTLVKESLSTIEEACKELRNSRLFLKLLEAVLKTGNRMNDGTFRGGAQAFKLDTLLKLSDVRGADGKTTLLHFVVQEIIRSEGRRAIRIARENRSNSNITISSSNSEELSEELPEQSEDLYRTLGLKAVSCMSSELENVKNAAGLDADALTITVAGLGHRLVRTKEFLNTDMRNLMEESSFHDSLKAFVEHAEADITYLLEEEKRVRLLVKNTTDYFHGSAGRDEGLRLFVIVRDFMGMVDKACKVVREAPKKVIKRLENKDNPTLQLIPERRQMLFPTIKEQHMDDFSSDEEGS